MKCVAKCADGEFVSVPVCAAKHMQFFKCMEESYQEEFWAQKESEVEYQESDLEFRPGLRVPIKTFNVIDKETGRPMRLRFTVSGETNNDV